jgi:tRNA threonylcarbamoyladenosine biosynthesis protein TsaB
MKVLGIDTTTAACSVALSGAGDLILERYQIEPRGHSNLVLTMVEGVLSEAGMSCHDLDAIAVDSGPGSFTGIRIGLGVAQGLTIGLDLPLLGVSSLMALAEGSGANTVLSAIDARMGQVYWGRLIRNGESAEGWAWRDEARVSDPAAVPPLLTDEVGIGSGWDVYSHVFAASKNDTHLWSPGCYPRASDIVRIACRSFDSGEVSGHRSISPIYIRDSVTLPRQQVLTEQ